MNFVILEIFLEFFWIFYEFNSIFFELKWIKIKFLSRADVAADVVRTKTAAPHGSVWERHVSHMCLCARVPACVINENKHPFQYFCYLINDTVLIYRSNRHNFCHVGLFYSVFLSKWHACQYVECVIERFNCDCRSSLKGVRSALILVDKFF